MNKGLYNSPKFIQINEINRIVYLLTNTTIMFITYIKNILAIKVFWKKNMKNIDFKHTLIYISYFLFSKNFHINMIDLFNLLVCKFLHRVMWGKSGTEVIPALFSFLHYSLISQKVMNEYLQSRQIWNLRDQRMKNSLVCPHSKRVFFVYCTNRKQRLLYRTIYFLSMVHKGSLCDKSIYDTGK